MIKTIIFFLVLFFLSAGALAQDNGRQIGARIGFIPGVTYLQSQRDNTALEGILSTEGDEIYLTGLFERYYGFNFQTIELNWYVGGGAHIGLRDNDRYYNDNPGDRDSTRSTQLLLGVDGIIGLAYKIQDIPLRLSLDWKPIFNLVEDFDTEGADLALSIRYIF